MAQTATIRLLTGDYPDRLNSLWAAAMAAQNDKTPRTLADEDPFDVLSREYEALKAEAEEAGLSVTIKAVGRREWRTLKQNHPARVEGDPETIKGDRLAGLNTSTVEDDLVYASLVSPEFTSRAAYDEWADALSEGEFQTILTRAWQLANVAQYDPKSLPASRTPSNAGN
ncbi:hypothetical protein [uncultured Arthrobacter sp.]|uniref:hypothetical protein n=1 Tax=uncultured Arthrobacter sp. TaxID=114050 RepID=UPI0025F51B4D|nr:hypothetical protein [uncultured Arthrobacter sp.]